MSLFCTLLPCLLGAARGLVLAPADAVPLFSHIPKNGGTWLTSQLEARKLGWFDAGHRCFSKIPCSGWHVPVGLAVDAGCAGASYRPGQQMFAVLRHPYQRAVSQWTWGHTFWSKVLGYEETADGMNRFIQDSVSNSTVPDDGAGKCSTSHSSFGKAECGRKCGRFLQDCHWLPQSDYVFDSGRNQQLVTTLLNQSTLSQEFRTMLGEHGQVERGAADYELASHMEDGATASVFNAWLCVLTTRSKQMLDMHYAEDFAKFGHLFDRANYLSTPCQPGSLPALP